MVSLSLISLTLLKAILAIDYSQSGNNWTGLCETGMEQSPIDLSDAEEAPYLFESILASYASGGSVTEEYTATDLEGKLSAKLLSSDDELVEFTASRLRVTSPAEHMLRGIQYDVEVQIYHHAEPSQSIAQNRSVAALSVIFREGQQSDFLQKLIVDKSVDLSLVFDKPEIRNYVMYEGSLTVPPCTENVNWFVYGEVLEASREQIDIFEELWAKNSTANYPSGNTRTA
jgi:carbonic anhydrase